MSSSALVKLNLAMRYAAAEALLMSCLGVLLLGDFKSWGGCGASAGWDCCGLIGGEEDLRSR